MNAHKNDRIRGHLPAVIPAHRLANQKLHPRDWPVIIDRIGLSWLMGRQFLVITHRGRKSRLVRQTGVMVLHHDKLTGEICVAAGSLKADWYRNIQVEPALSVSHAGHRFAPTQRFLTPEELAKFIVQARRSHPIQAWIQSRFFHWPWTTSLEEVLPLARSLGGVIFRPA